MTHCWDDHRSKEAGTKEPAEGIADVETSERMADERSDDTAADILQGLEFLLKFLSHFF